MHITIAAIGKMKPSSPYAMLIASYTKRMPWGIDIREMEEKRPIPPEQLKEKEAELLLAAIPPAAKIIALDERGKNLASREFAHLLRQWQDRGEHRLAFLIGGAAGHGEQVRQQADVILSLGEMTWPHMLVRAMIVEQLYRGYTLLSGHPYHKE